MSELNIAVDTDKDQKIAAILKKNLREFNKAKIGTYEYIHYTIYITDENENITGGLYGEILDKVCVIYVVWVHENTRKKGLGTEIFNKLEAFAKDNNCKILQVDTAEFQARQFYEKIGFSVVATLPENFMGFTTFIMRKTLY